jgi:hypothetical protein
MPASTSTITPPGELKDLQVKAIWRALDILLVALYELAPPEPEPWVEELDDRLHGLRRDAEGNLQFIEPDPRCRQSVSRERSARISLHGLDPVRIALWQALRSLGESLHELGSRTAMDNACGHIALQHPGEARWWAGLLDATWSGIGGWEYPSPSRPER